MGLTDILSTSTLICLGIMLLLLGGVAMFFMQKINEQNHKISSMLGLVSTMAEELNFVRSRMQILSSGVLVGQNGGISENGATISGASISGDSNNLIPVSDEDDDEEEESDDDEEEDSESDEEDTDSDEEETDSDEDDKQNIKTINMGETLEMNVHCETLAEEEQGEGTSSNSELDDELESLNDENLEVQDDFDNDTELKEDDTLITNTDFIKSIDISSLEESHKDSDTYDYKKMSLNKLRSVVVEKGIVSDSSKLKKNELLKLLSSE